ncbi:SDR family oxidoreductase [Herbiconiux sp. CPCC 203407]|uniref:SDR family oxidoreductase n=1 Tax=Herbiconiux oxytropis TaxID=2970915 RepID=A0AA41XF09_9MICO|nr:SDR family oxidoreductase [Herbiconiux oxytropis]MCS5723748.1 SDR family oxidoreductase [Herbiconiux oxytropis]MCS5725248.1 SDR family oxidoreductase [Herbiconiux oxytropis]
MSIPPAGIPATSPIVVTGSTGGLGGRVARLLQDAGVPQRLLVRDPARAPEIAGAEVAVAEYSDGAALERALAGTRIVFMVSAAENADRLAEHRSFIDAARAAGVEHVVYTSFFGAAPDATFTLARDHVVTENLIREAGLGHTFLRDNLYTDFLPMLAGSDGVIRGPAGTGRVASVTRDDVAESAVRVLLDRMRSADAHADATYELTGPEALGLDEVAAIVTEARKRAGQGEAPVTYLDETLAEAYASRAGYDAPPWQLDAWVSTYTAIAAGELSRITADVEHLTGHPPRSLRDFLGLTGG